MQNVKGFESLVALKDEFETNERRWQEEITSEQKRKHNELFEHVGFKSGKEVIDWVLDGNKIYNEHDCYTYMYRQDDSIVHVFENYEEWPGPAGYTSKCMTIQEFIDWVNKVDTYNTTNKYFPYWVKTIY